MNPADGLYGPQGDGKARQKRSHTVLTIIMGALLPIVVILLLSFLAGGTKTSLEIRQQY